MGLMDKFKNLFTEEIEEVEEPIKKEVMQVEIPAPARRTAEEYEEEVKKEKPKEEIETPKEDEYKFPFFDDEDFSAMNLEPKPEKKKTSSYRKEPKEVYSPPKEEKKVFKPTPIISPVYGILDKNYQKEDIKKKSDKPRTYYNPKEATVDEIRNKAYGTLEDDIETTLFGRNRALFEEEKKDSVKAALDSMKTDEDVINALSSENIEELDTDLLGEKMRHGADTKDDGLTDLLEEELNKDDLEILEDPKEKKKETRETKKISDTELFDMIDSMYQKGDK